MRSKSFCLIALFALFLGSCKKDDDGFVNAVVVDSGDMSSQGCGYLLQLSNGDVLKPYELKSAYRHNGLEVQIKYHLSDIFETCGVGQSAEYNLIIIDDVKNKR